MTPDQRRCRSSAEHVCTEPATSTSLFADAFDTSLPGTAFSNATEGDAWMSTWCGSCANADDYDMDGGCGLTDVARLDRIPAAWTELDPASTRNRWLCRRWEPAAGYVFPFGDHGAAS